MRLVVPAETHCQIGEVDVGLALDLQRGLLQPIPAQHPLDRDTDVAAEHPLRGPRTPRGVRHHLLHPVKSIVVADPVDQLRQSAVGRVRFTGVGGYRVIQTRRRGFDVVVEMDWRTE